MWNSNDLKTFEQRGIAADMATDQIKRFATGFAPIDIINCATPEAGVLQLTSTEQAHYMEVWNKYCEGTKRIVKFVPASGAASRMFKMLHEFLHAEYDEPQTKEEKRFFDKLEAFAFYGALDTVCMLQHDKQIAQLISENEYKTIVRMLLTEDGLDYGNLPKGLLLFHHYDARKRTPVEEHLVEGSKYAKNNEGEVSIHFTVSENHQELFKQLFTERQAEYESKYSIQYDLSLSTQKPSTDTLAVDASGVPLRDNAGELIFRPGGHGALIHNLNDIDADVVFIKNIDNVTSENLTFSTIAYKKSLAGLLVETQCAVFDLIEKLDGEDATEESIAEAKGFLKDSFLVEHPEFDAWDKDKQKMFLLKKLRRPLRVCGMVRNDGEPGGGPFVVRDADGSSSLQILESSQIDLSNPEMKRIFDASTHFNPVDLVCATKDNAGERFDLTQFVDVEAGFISSKSKDGITLQALELPGLWNGAMSNWNTCFVEVPVETFTPVKTVLDLLKQEHQPM